MIGSEEFKNIVPILSGVIVALIGFGLNVLMLFINQRQGISSKIIEQYFKAREEITGFLCAFADIKTYDQLLEMDLFNASNTAVELYYKYYDILPDKVAKALLCFHMTLDDKNNQLYRIKKSRLICLSDEDYKTFLNEVSTLYNSKLYLYFRLMAGNMEERRAIRISLQARYVLNTMNNFFIPNKLKKWIK